MKTVTTECIPSYVAPFLWSYDIARIDLERDKKRIILNVLNLGTQQSTDWLFSVYSREDILDIVAKSLAGEWNKKSLRYWRLVLDIITPIKTKRIS